MSAVDTVVQPPAPQPPSPLAQMRKAIAPLILSLAGAIGVSMLDGNITVPELCAAAGTGLVSFAGAYAVKNKTVD